MIETKPAHYYGDISRRIFLLAAVLMLITLPFVTDMLNVPLWFSIVAIVAISIFAGLVSPKQPWVSWVNLVIGAVAFVIFEYETARAFRDGHAFMAAINELLAILFVLSVYFNSKTVRGFWNKNV